MKFVSHLDMNRFMTRLVAKSSIPVWYTEGFNQHIYLNFAIPLSLGFEGLYEVMDIRVTDEDMSFEEILEKLNAVSVPDIKFFEAKEVKLEMKDIGFAEYEIEFQELDRKASEDLRNFFNSKSIICEKRTKKGGLKEIDLVPNIKKAELRENKLRLILSAGNENNINPTLVINTFFESSKTGPLFYSVTRTVIYDKNMDKFA